jgi:hypothetical protein
VERGGAVPLLRLGFLSLQLCDQKLADTAVLEVRRVAVSPMALNALFFAFLLKLDAKIGSVRGILLLLVQGRRRTMSDARKQ